MGFSVKLIGTCIVVLLVSYLSSVVESNAATKVTVTQSSETVYTVYVSDVAKASAIDFTIYYDADTLSDPVISSGPVATGAGAMQFPNVAKRGELRVVFVTTAKGAFIRDNGLLATVTFTKKGTVPSRPPELKSEMFSDTGAQVSVESIVTPPAGAEIVGTPGSTDSTVAATTNNNSNNNSNNSNIEAGVNPVSANQTVQNPVGTMGSVTKVAPNQSGSQTTIVEYQSAFSSVAQEKSSTQTDVGSVAESTPPQSGQLTRSEKLQSSADPVDRDKENFPVSKKAAELPLVNMKSLDSVAERFRVYKGPRTLKGFSALFDDKKYKSAGVVQIPKIAVSDGKKMVTVKITLPAGSAVPSFSLKGANLKGLKSSSDKYLELEAVPQKNKLDVRLSLIMAKEMAEIPLLVVPPVSIDIAALSDQAMENLLLKAVSGNKVPVYDLNADGKQDYLDDYILVAHWMLKLKTDKHTPAVKTVVPR